MRAPFARLPTSPWRRTARRRALGLLAVALLALVVLAGGRLLPAVVAAGRRAGPAGTLVNPCNGETIALQERLSVLPYLAANQGGTREVSVNAVGLSGLGSRGTPYLPLGTSKAVLTFANGTLDFTAGGDFDLIGRGNQGQDYHFHSIARIKLSITRGLRGSGVTMQSRCG